MNASVSLPKALVTGGAAGLGRALVRQLVSQGYQVHVIDHDVAGLEKLQDAANDALFTHQIDLSDVTGLESKISDIAQFGKFNIVILNAGVSATGRFEKIPVASHQKVLAVNLTAPMLIANGLARRNAMSASANLVFISSLSYAVGYPGAASYAASKDALAIYAKSITKPFAKIGIAVTCVFPGPIRTAHAEKYSPSGSDDKSRMVPENLAVCILKAAKARKRNYYPGAVAKLSHIIGRVAPGFVTSKMRKLIFEKLDGEVF